MDKRDLLFLLPLPIVALSTILIPFTNDARIFQGVARLVDYYGTFPTSLDIAWEMKPIGNRLINYLLYKIGTLFTDFGSPLYPIIVKGIAVIFAILCCYYFARSFKKELVIPLFSITTIAVLTPMNFIFMQAEWFSVLLTLVSIGLLMRQSLWGYVGAGSLMFFVFLLKGISGLLIVSVICFIYLICKNDYLSFEKSFDACIGFCIAGIVFMIMCFTIFPHSLPDMMMAARLARVGQYSLSIYVNSMFEKLLTISAYIPAFFFTAIIGFYQLATIKLERIKYAALWIMWIAAFAIVFIQGEFFIYHYFVIILPGIAAFVIELYRSDETRRKTLYILSIASMLGLWAIFNSPVGMITTTENELYAGEFVNSAYANEKWDISNESSVLFLDPGSAPYFFLTNSSCRYSGPLPVQRHRPEWDVSYLSAYKEEYQCIMNYTGKYIVGLDWWFGEDLPERAEIYQKFNSEYIHVYNGSWDIWERKTDVFKYNEDGTINQSAYFCDGSYERLNAAKFANMSEREKEMVALFLG